MLKQRVLTALPLAALAIWGILTQPASVILYALLLFTSVAGWEWARLSGVQSLFARAAYAAVTVLLCYVLQSWLINLPDVLLSIMAFTVAFWCVSTYRMFMRGPVADDSLSVAKLLMGVVVLVSPLIALMFIREQGADWLLYVLSIVWIADIGAYFSGKRYGRIKLAPGLSPGKTREGLYGAMFATSCFSLMFAIYKEMQLIDTVILLIIAALATVISVIGDLFISLLKREKGLKDTGAILPGHGGVLDRIDSVTSSAPFFALLLSLVYFNG